MADRPTTSGWTLERHGTDATLLLTGDWIVRESGLRASQAPDVLSQAAGARRLCFETSFLGRWDSAVIIFVRALRDAVGHQDGASPTIELDESGLPEAARRLLALAASDVPAEDGEVRRIYLHSASGGRPGHCAMGGGRRGGFPCG